jgi:hypothetical protein
MAGRAQLAKLRYESTKQQREHAEIVSHLRVSLEKRERENEELKTKLGKLVELRTKEDKEQTAHEASSGERERACGAALTPRRRRATSARGSARTRCGRRSRSWRWS